MRTKIASALATVGLAAATLTALPGAAHANPEWYSTPAAAQSTRVQAAPDGFLHVWEHEKKGGLHCKWEGNESNWDNCNGMRNEASSVFNNGKTHDVWLYYRPNQKGAHFCLDRGEYLENIVHYRFPNNGGADGGNGQSLNDNIASHKWVANC
ncbi:peptidase inhibitor family I36 protein [Streptomyces sp. NPDC006356]